MNKVYKESTVQTDTETSGRMAAPCMNAEEMTKMFEKGLKDAKVTVADKFEDGKREAQRFMKRSRFAMEDKLTDSAHQMKRHPGTTLAAVFAAGALLGFMIPRLGRR
jgi:hypothetical protein